MFRSPFNASCCAYLFTYYTKSCFSMIPYCFCNFFFQGYLSYYLYFFLARWFSKSLLMKLSFVPSHKYFLTLDNVCSKVLYLFCTLLCFSIMFNLFLINVVGLSIREIFFLVVSLSHTWDRTKSIYFSIFFIETVHYSQAMFETEIDESLAIIISPSLAIFSQNKYTYFRFASLLYSYSLFALFWWGFGRSISFPF